MHAPVDSRFAIYASVTIVIAGCLLRLASLEADPDYYSWVGYLTDEGRWVENARSLMLFDRGLFPDSNIHLLMAPLFQAINYVAMSIFDIDRWSIRIFTAISGSAILILLWLGLKRQVSPNALAIGLAFVAVQEDLVMLSRMCVPEISAMMLELAIFLILLNYRESVARTAFAGLLMVACIATKATTAPLLLVFAMVAWFTAPSVRRVRILRITAFLAPAGVPVVLGAFLEMVLNAASGTAAPGQLSLLARDVNILTHFLDLNQIYVIVGFFIDNPIAPTVNVWLLPAWIGALTLLSAPDLVPQSTRRWMQAAAIWFFAYALLWLPLSYFPDRYKAHLLIPLAIMATWSIHAYLRAHPNRVHLHLAALTHGPYRLPFSLLLSLPLAVLLAPTIVWFATHWGVDGERMQSRILAIGAAWMILMPMLWRRDARAVGAAIALPVAGFSTWQAAHLVLGWQFWSTTDGQGPIQWLAIMGVAFCVTGLLATRPEGERRGERLALTAALVYVMAAVTPYGASLIWPQFTIRDVSRALGDTLDGKSDVVSHRVDGIFIDNDVPYDSIYRRSWKTEPPQIVVNFEDEKWDLRSRKELWDFLAANYREIESHDVFVSPRYRGGPVRIAVYQLDPAGTAR